MMRARLNEVLESLKPHCYDRFIQLIARSFETYLPLKECFSLANCYHHAVHMEGIPLVMLGSKSPQIWAEEEIGEGP